MAYVISNANNPEEIFFKEIDVVADFETEHPNNNNIRIHQDWTIMDYARALEKCEYKFDTLVNAIEDACEDGRRIAFAVENWNPAPVNPQIVGGKSKKKSKKIYIGKQGGKYYIVNGKKKYIK